MKPDIEYRPKRPPKAVEAPKCEPASTTTTKAKRSSRRNSAPKPSSGSEPQSGHPGSELQPTAATSADGGTLETSETPKAIKPPKQPSKHGIKLPKTLHGPARAQAYRDAWRASPGGKEAYNASQRLYMADVRSRDKDGHGPKGPKQYLTVKEWRKLKAQAP